MSYPPPYPPGGWQQPPPPQFPPPPPTAPGHAPYYAQQQQQGGGGPPGYSAPPPHSSYDGRRTHDHHHHHHSRRGRSRDRGPSQYAPPPPSSGNGASSNESIDERQRKMREMLMQQAAARAQAPPPQPQPSAPFGRPPPPHQYPPQAPHPAHYGGGYGGGGGARAPYNSNGSARPYNDRGPRGGGGSFAPSRPPAPNLNDKVFLELHVGNLPEMIESEEAFTAFLNDVYEKKGLGPAGAVLSTRINRAGHFAFAMFRTKEEATLGLALNGASCLGSSLRVERPKNYAQKLSALSPELAAGLGAAGSSSHLLALPQHVTPHDVELLARQIVQGKGTTLPPGPLPAFPGAGADDVLRALQASLDLAGPPSKTLDLVGFAEDPDALAQLEAWCKTSALGGFESARPEAGRVRVTFASERDAERALDVFVNKTFDGRPIKARFG